MNQSQKDQWLAWLRDPKNEQGNGYLKKDDEYCCLGGLCEISKLGEWIKRTTKGDGTYWYVVRPDSNVGYRDAAFLPEPVAEKYGLTTDGLFTPSIETLDLLKTRYNMTFVEAKTTVMSLAMLNDRGVSFFTIADIIERDFKTSD